MKSRRETKKSTKKKKVVKFVAGAVALITFVAIATILILLTPQGNTYLRSQLNSDTPLDRTAKNIIYKKASEMNLSPEEKEVAEKIKNTPTKTLIKATEDKTSAVALIKNTTNLSDEKANRLVDSVFDNEEFTPLRKAIQGTHLLKAKDELMKLKANGALSKLKTELSSDDSTYTDSVYKEAEQLYGGE